MAIFNSYVSLPEGNFLGVFYPTPWISMALCHAAGDYKTEVCRRLAEKMQLQWLQPNYVALDVDGEPKKSWSLMDITYIYIT